MVAELNDRVDRWAKTDQISLSSVKILAQISDPIIIAIVGLVACIVYVVVMVGGSITSPIVIAIVMGAIGTSAFCHWFGTYGDQALFTKQIPIDRLIAAWAIVFATLLFIAFSLKISSHFSRVWAVTWFAGGACALVGTRLLMRQWIQQQVRNGSLVERVVIFGAGKQGQRFAAQINSLCDPFIRVLGFVDDRTSRVSRTCAGYELLGDTRVLINLIRAGQVDQVYIALPTGATKRITDIMEQLANTPVCVSLVFDELGLGTPNKTLRYIMKSPTLRIFDRPITGWSHILKLIEDKVIATLALIFMLPLMLVIAVAVRLDSPGPILFRQRRYGFNDRSIEVWKFRTMYADCGNGSEPIRQATKNDARVTRIGRVLRHTSLDELPQFINVLTGDMSIVGPRPHAVGHMYGDRELADIVDRYAARHRVKPGITGWAQVNGWRGETDTVEKLKKRVEHDLYYIDNWSIWFDLTIIWRTTFVILKGDNAY